MKKRKNKENTFLGGMKRYFKKFNSYPANTFTRFAAIVASGVISSGIAMAFLMGVLPAVGVFGAGMLFAVSVAGAVGTIGGVVALGGVGKKGLKHLAGFFAAATLTISGLSYGSYKSFEYSVNKLTEMKKISPLYNKVSCNQKYIKATGNHVYIPKKYAV